MQLAQSSDSSLNPHALTGIKPDTPLKEALGDRAMAPECPVLNLRANCGWRRCKRPSPLASFSTGVTPSPEKPVALCVVAYHQGAHTPSQGLGPAGQESMAG